MLAPRQAVAASGEPGIRSRLLYARAAYAIPPVPMLVVLVALLGLAKVLVVHIGLLEVVKTAS